MEIIDIVELYQQEFEYISTTKGRGKKPIAWLASSQNSTLEALLVCLYPICWKGFEEKNESPRVSPLCDLPRNPTLTHMLSPTIRDSRSCFCRNRGSLSCEFPSGPNRPISGIANAF